MPEASGPQGWNVDVAITLKVYRGFSLGAVDNPPRVTITDRNGVKLIRIVGGIAEGQRYVDGLMRFTVWELTRLHNLIDRYIVEACKPGHKDGNDSVLRSLEALKRKLERHLAESGN